MLSNQPPPEAMLNRVIMVMGICNCCLDSITSLEVNQLLQSSLFSAICRVHLPDRIDARSYSFFPMQTEKESLTILMVVAGRAQSRISENWGKWTYLKVSTGSVEFIGNVVK